MPSLFPMSLRPSGAWRLLMGGLACMVVGTARCEVWAFVDENGDVHTAPTQVDSRYQKVTGGGGTGAKAEAPKPTAAPLTTSTLLGLPPSPAEGALAPAPVPAATAPTSLGRRRNESPEAWMARLNAAPAVRALQPLLREAAQATGVDPILMKAVIAVESGFNPQAVSAQGALGLMQIMPETADRFGTAAEKQRPAAERLLEPRTNILTGARILADLGRRFDRIELVLAAWNSGEATVRKHGGLPPIGQTEQHVLQVLELYWAMLQYQMPPGVVGSMPR